MNVVTREQITDVRSGLASFQFSERKSGSISPEHSNKHKRKIIVGRRGLHRRNDNGMLNKRVNTPTLNSLHGLNSNGNGVIRKRTFAEMSAGSLTLARLFRRAPVIRVPSASLFYVRMEGCPKPIQEDSSDESNSNGVQSPSETQPQRNVLNPFSNSQQVSRKRKRKEEKCDDRDEDNDVSMASGREDTDEEGTWVEAFNSLNEAGSEVWKAQHPYGKIHEYQIQSKEGIMLFDLSKINPSVIDCIQSVQRYALDHGCSGYLLDGKTILHNPQDYWSLIDDDKHKGRVQYLISDMFKMQSLQSPPTTQPFHSAFQPFS